MKWYASRLSVAAAGLRFAREVLTLEKLAVVLRFLVGGELAAFALALAASSVVAARAWYAPRTSAGLQEGAGAGVHACQYLSMFTGRLLVAR